MQLSFHKYNGLPQVINKDIGEPYAETEVGQAFTQPYSLMNPTIQLTGTVTGSLTGDIKNMLFNQGVNYIRVIDDVNDIGLITKYYHIMDYEFLHHGHAMVKLHLDVLMTYSEELKNYEVILDRSSESEEHDAIDSMMPLSSDILIERVDLPSSISESENAGTYVLVTAQDGYRKVGEGVGGL